MFEGIKFKKKKVRQKEKVVGLRGKKSVENRQIDSRHSSLCHSARLLFDVRDRRENDSPFKGQFTLHSTNMDLV